MRSVTSRPYAVVFGLSVMLWSSACADTNAPPPPALDPVPSPTHDLVVTLTGSAEPHALIEVTGAVAVAPAIVKADKFTSLFRVTVTLAPDATNTLEVTATDREGNKSKPAEVVIVHETAPGPVVDPVASPTHDRVLTLTGTAEPNARIAITGAVAVAPEVIVVDGFTARFSATVTLAPDATNTLAMTATDPAGNVSHATQVVIVHETARGPFVDPVPPLTGDLTITLTGNAEPGAAIDVAGAVAAVPAPALADPFTGRFRVDVTLAPDTTNTLEVTATDPAGNETHATEIVVVHETGHGIPASLAIALYVGAATEPSSDDPLEVPAGSTLRAEATVRDAHGHALNVPLVLSTDAPGAFVVGDTVSGLETAGAFAIAAQVPGTLFGASRNIVVTPGAAAAVALEATPAEVVAGQPVAIAAHAEDAFGNRLGDIAITLTSTPPLAPTFTPPCSPTPLTQGFLGSSRFVAFDLANAADGFTLTATAGTLSASANVLVRPGPAARFAPNDRANCAAGEAFTFTDATWTTPLTGPAAVSAGQSVYYRYAVIDAYGNPTTGPVNAFTTAPGAQVIDDGISGRGQIANLSAAGTFTLAGYITGVAAPALRTFSVDVADATVVNVFLSASLASRGDTVQAFATVKDRFGNLVPCPSGAVTPAVFDFGVSPSDGVVEGATTCTNGLFQGAFTFGVNDSYAVSATWHPGANPVSASAFVTVLGIDSTPPSVAVANVRINGVLCAPGTPPTCSVTRGDVVTFDVVASDNVSLSEIEYAAFFESTQQLRTRRVLIGSDTQLPATVHFTFTVSNGAQPELVPLVAMAVDGSGNRTVSDELLLSVDVFAAGGRAVSVIASGGLVQAPRDIAFDAAGNLYVANDGAGNLLRIDAGTDVPYRYSNWSDGSSYLAVDASGAVFVTNSNGDVDRIGSNLSVAAYISLNNAFVGGLTALGGNLFAARIGSTSLIRFATNATPVLDETDALATYNVARSQESIAVKDASSGAGLDNLYLYAIDSQQRGRLVSYHAQGGNVTQVFSLTQSGGQSFQSLYDLALEPTLPVPAANPKDGCLLVTDTSRQAIYAIDVRDPNAVNPNVTEIASGFSEPRGLAFFGGDLYVVDSGYDAIIRISPSANATDCF